jgi:hypothetical protein
MLFVLGKREGIKAKHLRAIPVLILESWVQGGREEGVANYIWTNNIARRLVNSGLVPPFKPKGTSVILASLTTIQGSRNLTRPPLIEYRGEGMFWVNLPHYEPLLQEYRPKYRELYPDDYEMLFSEGEPEWEPSGKVSVKHSAAKPMLAKSEGRDEKQSLLAPAQQTPGDKQRTGDFLANKTNSITSFMSHCDHCGNVTFKIWITSHKVKNSEQKLVEYKLYKCQICEDVILQKESTQIWPPAVEFSSEVPERIRKIYEEARNVRKRSSSSFVVQIRRALEAVTKERNAEGKDLFNKIEWLIQQGQLPPVFGKMSQISRKIANLGAHDAETDVQPNDADIVDEFFRAIIEYIYIAPAKVDRVIALEKE